MGANIGMFSCVAAAKSKTVYAFEPTPETKKLLDKQTVLFNNIITEEYAVSDEDGVSILYVNNVDGVDANSGSNTMIAERLEGKDVHQIEIKTITIDTFVKEKNLGSVDFIKADIEGSERNMLIGAKDTLARFSPKLALCTYHLPDDPEVLENIILQCNPNYIIKQGEKKLWAYVEKRK